MFVFFFFFNDTATTEIYTLSLHDALPTSTRRAADAWRSNVAARISGAACALALATLAAYSDRSFAVQTFGFSTGLPSLPMTTGGGVTTGAGAGAGSSTGAGAAGGASTTGGVAGTTTSGATTSGATTSGAASVTVVVSSAKAAGAMATAPKAVTPVRASVTATRRRGVIVMIMSASP